MPVIRLDDLDDPRLEPYRHLKDTNRTRWQNLFVVEGVKLVERLLASRVELLSAFATHGALDKLPGPLPVHVPVYVVPDALADRLIGYRFHYGVMACGRRPPLPQLDELTGPPGTTATLAVCADIHDPENCGSILRTSHALGLSGVLLGAGGCDPWSRRVTRCSMGAPLKLPVRTTEDLAGELRALRQDFGVVLAATVLDPSAQLLGQWRRPSRLAVLFGSEGHGLSADLRSLCDVELTVPMQQGVDSLNVAVAAGIFLYELTRAGQQRESTSTAGS